MQVEDIFPDLKTLFLTGLIIVASGCAAQGTGNIESVSSNPEAYEGEEVVLQGEVRGYSNESVKQPAESGALKQKITDKTSESVENEKINARHHSGIIGDVDGQIDFMGCEPSTFASEVRVKGTIESYKTCDCQPQGIDETLDGRREKIAGQFDRYKGSEEVELSYEEPSPEEDVFTRVCKEGINSSTISVEVVNTTIDLDSKVEHQGCVEDTTEKHYYFSCKEILEEYE